VRPTNRIRRYLDRDHRVLLYNDSTHSFEEVAQELSTAAGCDLEVAFYLAGVVHKKGRAVVFSGRAEECREIVEKLRSIGLQAEVDDPFE
jgi:ATP-dependent Clp protease adapter protein ClpS